VETLVCAVVQSGKGRFDNLGAVCSSTLSNLPKQFDILSCFPQRSSYAGLAQSVERQALNLMVEGSSPSVGVVFICGVLCCDDVALK
jgi:hypothetical protein